MSATNRLDRIIGELEKLQNDADQILDAHVDELRKTKQCHPSWGVTKNFEIAAPAGLTINRVKALLLLRDKVTGGVA
jgi:hypothetical protein